MKKKNKILSDQRKKKSRGYKKEQNRTIPTYDIKGGVTTEEKKRKEKRIARMLIIFAVIIGILYIPGFFMSDNREPVVVALDTQKKSDEQESNSVKMSSDYLKNNADSDFDNDGVLNSEEMAKGMNPWRMDTDSDFMTDLSELRYTKTDPLKQDNRQIISIQQKLDNAKGKKLSSPYKIGQLDVLLYASDYTSKAIGSVAQTMKGYNFCGFNGYAKFVEGGYAYSYANGIHTLLPYRSPEGVWEIHSDNVELFNEKLEEIIEFGIFGQSFYAPSNFITDAISFILPRKGFFVAEKKMKIDTEVDGEDKTIQVQTASFPEDSLIRFGKNNIAINDLLYVREQIDNNICVAVSLFRPKVGEFIGLIYGYDSRGNFFVADEDTHEEVGKLNIINTSYKYLNEKGDLIAYTYFDFVSDFCYVDENNRLASFSSYNGDNINFFAASMGGSSPSNSAMEEAIKEKQKEKNNHTDAITTEAPSTEISLETTQTTETDTTSTTVPSNPTNPTDTTSPSNVQPDAGSAATTEVPIPQDDDMLDLETDPDMTDDTDLETGAEENTDAPSDDELTDMEDL